jgi:hypothetical protein
MDCSRDNQEAFALSNDSIDSQDHSFESKWGRNRSQVLASLERPTRNIPTVSQAKQRPESTTPSGPISSAMIT